MFYSHDNGTIFSHGAHKAFDSWASCKNTRRIFSQASVTRCFEFFRVPAHEQVLLRLVKQQFVPARILPVTLLHRRIVVRLTTLHVQLLLNNLLPLNGATECSTFTIISNYSLAGEEVVQTCFQVSINLSFIPFVPTMVIAIFFSVPVSLVNFVPSLSRFFFFFYCVPIVDFYR